MAKSFWNVGNPCELNSVTDQDVNQQKAAHRIRLSIESVETCDESMRFWLLNKKRTKTSDKSVENKCDTLYLRPIDASVLESSYITNIKIAWKSLARQDYKKHQLNRESSPAVIVKLKRARYVKEKRIARASAKHYKDLQVIVEIHTTHNTT